MTKQLKQAYETPTTETLVVRFEGAILDASITGGSGFGDDGQASVSNGSSDVWWSN